MCDRKTNNQKQILIFSALLASGFAVGGLVLGLLVGSLVIVFDGVYSLVSLLLTLLSLSAAYYISRPQKSRFPFGKSMIEPIVIAIKASVILVIVGYSLFSAVQALFSGGREVDASIATIFGIVNVLGCGFGWWYIAKKGRQVESGLIDAEAKQWQMDTLLSVAVTLGFLAALALTYSPWAEYAVYADPMMMVAMSFYFIKVPFDMLRDAMRELLMMRPSGELCRSVGKEIAIVDGESTPELSLAALTKVGQELRVDVDMRVKQSSVSVVELERIRNTLKKRLSKHASRLQLHLNVAA
ncbi:cation diffusion facilitator family transporter [Vibrio maerlii]|uniref:cation diffusion facilitator family transporter n=1 Tax=Vibrio maerlii TaxID=2231648 RepID=UPI000E3CA52B|nr:cation diffusion facilitator family transporter [Vibrio maerlii]